MTRNVPISEIRVGQRKRKLDPERVAQLAESIGEVGLLNPITISPDKCLRAGWHRLEACKRLGYVTIQANELDGSDLHGELAEIDENLIRNDLTVLEQGEHLTRRDEILRQLGLRADSGDNRFTDRGDKLSPLPKTTADVAAELGMDERTAQRRKQAAKIAPEAREVLRDLPVADNQSELLKIAKLPEQDQGMVARMISDGQAKDVAQAVRTIKTAAVRERATEIARTTPLPELVQVVTGDFRQAMRDLPDASAALVFTDPPYDENSVPMYADMAREAARVLVDGGSMLCYVGHYAVGDVINAVSAHLRFWWTCGVKHEGPSARLPGKWVFVEWKPILWFVKNGRRDTEYVADMVTSTDVPSKAEHEWQQGIAEASYYIERLTQPGELVVDPFLGSGTTLIAAAKASRVGWGCELDQQRADVARGRIAEAFS